MEIRRPNCVSQGGLLLCRAPEANDPWWILSNGLWALFIAFGMVLTGLKVQQARSWRFFNPAIRGFLADYGVTMAVVVWSCMSYALTGAPEGIPRRMALPNTWRVTGSWGVAGVLFFPCPPSGLGINPHFCICLNLLVPNNVWSE